MTKQRVVVTGLGTINPLGNNVITTWNNLINGVSGVDYITLFDASDLPVTFAGEVKDFDPNDYMGKQNARKLDRSGQLSIFAAEEALRDAGFDIDQPLGEEFGIVFGLSLIHI